MPLDTKAAEVETNMEELIITVTHKNFSDLSRSKIVFAEQNYPYLWSLEYYLTAIIAVSFEMVGINNAVWDGCPSVSYKWTDGMEISGWGEV